jgi:hypothetical protein
METQVSNGDTASASVVAQPSPSISFTVKADDIVTATPQGAF